jgi:hypothetical protein
MKRILRQIAVPAGVVGALVATIADPAVAATNAKAECGITRDGMPCGYATFKASGANGAERLYLLDFNSDGYGVAVENYRYDLAAHGPYYGTVTGGYEGKRMWTLHMLEGAKIKFRVCPYTSAHGIYSSKCGAWEQGTA